MAVRAINSATITFGLVSIPIKVYAATETSSTIHFNTLHKDCGSRLKQQYICPKHDVVVPRTEMAKGYEFSKGRYVVFDADELKALQPEPTYAIDIDAFVPEHAVDPMFYEKTYYLGPDKGGERAYQLLTQAMQQTQRHAIARYAARGKDYLVLVRPKESGLVLQQLAYADSLKSFDEVPLGRSVETDESELLLAVQLIEQIARDDFDANAYEDRQKARTLELIDQKIQGHQITAEPQEKPQAQIVDLMEALKASVGLKPDAPLKPKPPRRAPAKKKTTRRKKTASKG